MLSAKEMQLRQDYWATVQQCLIRIHHMRQQEASIMVRRYKQRFPVRSQEPSVELVYHFEPFRLACDIAGRKLSVRNHSTQYRQILSELNDKPKASKGPLSGKTVQTISVKVPAALMDSFKQKPAKTAAGKKQIQKKASEAEKLPPRMEYVPLGMGTASAKKASKKAGHGGKKHCEKKAGKRGK
jgi:hypothetical protein